MPRRSPYMQNNKKPEDVLKALASIATSAVAEPVSGLGGILAGVMTNDSKKGADAVSRIQDAMTYQPPSEGAKETLQTIGKTLAPVGEVLDKSANYLGDNTLKYTGSEELATLAHLLPTILSEALPAAAGVRQLSKGAYPEVPSNFRQSGMARGPVKALEDKWKEKANLDLYEGKDNISLSSIRVNDDIRNQGVGSEIMQDVIDYSDKAGKRLDLTPSKDFGATSVNRLKKFYKQFGLVENKGRNKDYAISDTMYRNPETPIKQLTEFEEAHAIAQLNASKPVSEGGLGLPKNNTPMDRAEAMGFENKDWYHGTTHDINKFLAADAPTANKEGYFGAGTYLTDSPLDASDNYAGMGPDLTNRVQQLKERYEQDFKDNPEEYDMFEDTDFSKAATERAHKELLGNNQGVIYPVMTRPKNTFDYDYGEVGYKDPELNLDDYMDDAKNELDIDDYDGDKYSYDVDVEERAQEMAYEDMSYQEPEGVIEDMHDTFRQADSYDDAGDAFQTALQNHEIDQYGGDVPAKDFIDNLRNSYISDANTGDNIASDITAQSIENAGFDAINMNADMAFGNQSDMARYGNGMSMDYDTQHQVLRDPSLIRSKFAAFDPKKKNSRNILAGISSAGVSLPMLAKMLEQEEQGNNNGL